MDQATHNKIVSFIWGIADDVLRDLFKRGKYPDVILPMFVLRRMDAVLEPTKKAVLETREMLDKAGITEQRAALAAAAGQSFYNTSRFTLRDLRSRGSQQQLLADFEDYLNGFSPNVQDILENSKFRNQLSTLSKSDSLSTLIGKFLDPEINLSPDPVLNSDHTVKHPGMDNHSMGTVFEELVRKFNEENNEEAGEHWTPRDAVRLMAMLIFLPIADASRIAEVHNGSSLFTGDAGQGESNIRRWLIENDWLEAIVALPLNLFYNTGIATYIWVLTNRKPDHRKGQVQLIDATQWFKPLRKNLGKKNCELAPEDIQRICDTYLAFQETPQSKLFPNAAFGYWKVTVERPLRLHSQLSVKAIESLRFASGDEDLRASIYDEFGDKLVENFPSIAETLEKRLADWSEASDSPDPSDSFDDAPKKTLPERTKRRLLDPSTWADDAQLVATANALRQELGGGVFEDYNIFRDRVNDVVEKLSPKLSATDLKLILRAMSWRVETAPPVIAKQQKLKPGEHVTDQEKFHGSSELRTPRSALRIQFEPDPDLRDTEQVPLLEAGGIEAFIRREVLPYTPDAWIKEDATKIGYEISFTRHFYQPQPLRTLDAIRADILAVEKEAEGLLDELLHGGAK